MGAAVRGIDLSEESVGAAAAHAAGDPLIASRVAYRRCSAEDELAAAAAEGRVAYDVVVASEVIEHVRSPGEFLKTLAALAGAGGSGDGASGGGGSGGGRGGGRVVISTLNRTPAAFALAVVGAEYVTGLVPRGTHDWSKFITPQELALMASDAGLEVEQVAGMGLDPLRRGGRFVLTDDLGVNYIALLRARGGQ
ncbi:hypothetical protein MNEG_6040 [Monoraphidium neglectum]|uniref:Methyltransferase type 12 domain-containing protein n=1 Tax=Monoraphidium neglectum TaxID=145388 RepID=A0A0D2L416_9CHLO|nr:hypothetical protein MNEG_6040 [Monoraphidium neglectum]KIZ01919.1 hypothetical protein MNEG_6040 [Monoraphidium neglectum]|eukprot:XP_013900938.1 hypothetical protein MNEG_6040 [Monoraphidium neglectum]